MALHLVLDLSSSMGGDKLAQLKIIAAIFSEAMVVMSECVDGHIWGFDSGNIGDYGPPGPDNGFVHAEVQGGNCDSQMLPLVANAIAASPRRCKIVIVIADDGPDDIKTVRNFSHQMLGRGIIVIHVMIGVHGSPKIYPYELPFDDMADFVREFGSLLVSIMSNIR